MASATFEELKAQVAMKAEETGTLPTTITHGGVQYTLQMPVETKMAVMQAMKNPARLDDALDRVTFVGTNGTEVHA